MLILSFASASASAFAFGCEGRSLRESEIDNGSSMLVICVAVEVGTAANQFNGDGMGWDGTGRDGGQLLPTCC